jgi:DNA polymerase-4
MAGERKKPDGMTVVRLNELQSFYTGLKLTDITGINWRMEQVLKNFCINSPTDFFDCSLPKLRECLNHPGRMWYFRLRGYEVDDHSSPTKTVGHSHVLPPKYRSKEGAEAVIHRLIFKTASRLRKENFWAGGVSVCIGFYDRGSFALSRKTTNFCDTKSLTDHIFLLLKNCRWQSRPIYVSISTFNLAQFCGNQISIFSEIEKQKSVSFALDKINDQYGPDTVYPASMHMALESAPDRIPFGRPRYEILH